MVGPLGKPWGISVKELTEGHTKSGTCGLTKVRPQQCCWPDQKGLAVLVDPPTLGLSGGRRDNLARGKAFIG
jgi:hypothetical protein